MKSLTELAFTAEPKGKESFRATDPAGNIFLSNQRMPVNVENDDRRYAVTSMNPKHMKDRKYWNALVAAIKDERVQRAFFTQLVNRDLSKYVMQHIPDTKMRRCLKKNKNKNHILSFLTKLVTIQGFTTWYRDDIERKDYRFFSKVRIRASFYDWLEDNSIARRYQPWPRLELRLKEAGLVVKRVTDRSASGDGRQVICYQLDKDVVREIHRSMLENVDWDFPEVVDTKAEVADKDKNG
jgi:hypothetical protein